MLILFIDIQLDPGTKTIAKGVCQATMFLGYSVQGAKELVKLIDGKYNDITNHII
jgi:hypothetical protein